MIDPLYSVRPDWEFMPDRIAMIWPEPEPDCHPKKVAGFDRIGRI